MQEVITNTPQPLLLPRQRTLCIPLRWKNKRIKKWWAAKHKRSTRARTHTHTQFS